MHLALKSTPLEVEDFHPKDHVLLPVIQMLVKIVFEHMASCR